MKKIFTILITSLLVLGNPILFASNYVKVATIGNRPSINQIPESMEEVVEYVKDFWRKELGQVFPDKPDLILLPEYSDIPDGLSNNLRDTYLSVRGNQLLDLFSSISNEKKCYIVFGSVLIDKDSLLRNSSVVIDRKGHIVGKYYKNYPPIAELDKGFIPGTEPLLVQCDFGTIAPIICFDLNFEELLQKYVQLKPDILLFSSLYHGGLMQNYWAYKCQSFFIGSMGSRSIPSEIRNPLGNVVASSTNYYDYAIANINLDNRIVHLDFNWVPIQKLKEKYGNDFKLTDPGKLGVVLIESKNRKKSIDEMIEEADITILDDYFDASKKKVKDKIKKD